jgi:hypothetical protein
MADQMATAELEALAESVASWADDVFGLHRVYIFGSRVRGDHKPASDVDIRIYTSDLDSDDVTTCWWTEQHDTGFPELQKRLPGKLHLPNEWDDAEPAIRAAMTKPPVLVVRKVICLLTLRWEGRRD